MPKEDTCLLSTNKNWRAVLSTCGVAHWIYKHFLNPNVNLNSKAKNYIVLRWIKVLGNDLPSRVGWSWIYTNCIFHETWQWHPPHGYSASQLIVDVTQRTCSEVVAFVMDQQMLASIQSQNITEIQLKLSYDGLQLIRMNLLLEMF